MSEIKKAASKKPRLRRTNATEWQYRTFTKSSIQSKPEQQAQQYIKGMLEGISIGEKRAIKKLEEQFVKEFSGNINKAKKFGEEFFKSLKSDFKTHCDIVYLRTDGMKDFKLLFLIKPEDYLSSEFNKVYEKSIIEKNKINNDSFHISLMFIPEVESLDRNKISSDGYTTYYGKAKK